MPRGLHFWPDLRDHPVLIQQERDAVEALDDLAVEVLRAPNAARLRQLVLGIGKKRERQALLVGELLVRLHAVRAYSENRNALELREGVAETARLGGSAGRSVLR